MSSGKNPRAEITSQRRTRVNGCDEAWLRTYECVAAASMIRIDRGDADTCNKIGAILGLREESDFREMKARWGREGKVSSVPSQNYPKVHTTKFPSSTSSVIIIWSPSHMELRISDEMWSAQWAPASIPPLEICMWKVVQDNWRKVCALLSGGDCISTRRLCSTIRFRP